MAFLFPSSAEIVNIASAMCKLYFVKVSFKKTNLEMQINVVWLKSEAGSPAKDLIFNKYQSSRAKVFNNYPSWGENVLSLPTREQANQAQRQKPMEINFGVNILPIFKFCQVRGKTIIFNNHHLVEIEYVLIIIEEALNLGITPWSLH